MACGCVSRCKTCNAAILWAKTATGKNMPIDCEPVPEGNIRLDGAGVAHVLTVEEKTTFNGPRRNSHWVTCPQSRQHRRA